ncbi:hypothetical protein KFL_001510150 [Klebsormidium nitens]|uniref:Uncharacterized protein n=1 Tax=Klebsormidium nitens TaxID=105231 RepID=A0A1Y1I0M2_KLENI|nr:hypothetical protein KFL_001510150 [Klebsormidium nitens]|eukprot:GAQ83512.1 hypothetical protein KFL_001510150 [Klebsormidium nitens]
MASSAYVGGMAQLGRGTEQFSVRRSGGACSTSQAGCCGKTAVDVAPRAHAGARQSRLKVDLLRGQSGNGCLHMGSLESSVGIFRSAREQQRAEGSKVRCLLRGVGDSFWDGSERRTPNSFAFTGRMPYRSEHMPSVLRDIILQIEPLDIQQLAQDASSDAMDAMKRTISGMLGLLPSDQFSVIVETEREALARLLVSSMMTGYTLRNAEYRLSLQRSWESDGGEEGAPPLESVPVSGHPEVDGHLALDNDSRQAEVAAGGVELRSSEGEEELEEVGMIGMDLEGLPVEAAEYVRKLQSKLAETQDALSSAEKTLSALKMEGVTPVPPPTGEDEGNALLDYLRSLEADKVAELSKPGTPDVEEAIRAVIDGLLGNLGPSQQAGAPRGGAYGGAGMRAGGGGWETRRAVMGEGLGASPQVPGLEFQQTVTASRDYLARLLFWCMLLGHYTRGVELRLDLNCTFSLHGLGTFGKRGCGNGGQAEGTGSQRSWSKTPLDGEAPSF